MIRQSTVLSDPAPHTAARSAASTSAFTENQVLTDDNRAPTAMPTTISRKPCTPRRNASRYTASAVPRPPASAPAARAA